jgi:glucokinase
MIQAPVVLGLDFGGTKIAVAVCRLDGTRLGSATVGSGGELGARASFDRGVATARNLLASTAPGVPLAAVGVSTFGIPFDDRVELAPAISGWGELPLGRELRAAFPGSVVRMATDAKAAAAAEVRWGALADCDPAIYLNLGTGLSAALVSGGQVIGGANGAAGEIGYNLRALADVGHTLDDRVPLEDMISGQALARRAAALDRIPDGPARTPGGPARTPGGPARTPGGPARTPGGPARTPGGPARTPGGTGRTPDGAARTPDSTDGRPLAAADVLTASAAEPDLDQLASEFVAELAFHVVNLAILVNPVRIAVGGGLVQSWDRLRPGLEQALSAGTPFPPELVTARFPADAPLIGAVALAADAARADGAIDGATVTHPLQSISEGHHS